MLKVGEQKSPVSGEPWKQSLSPDYAKKKKSEGAPPIPNMELSGKMLDALSFQNTKDGIEIGIFGKKAWQADGHNHFSAASEHAKAPKRRFLPDEGQNFKPEIKQGIEKIIADNIIDSESLKKTDLKDIETRKDFFDFLKEKFTGLSISEITEGILRNKKLFDLIEEMDLEEFLIGKKKRSRS